MTYINSAQISEFRGGLDPRSTILNMHLVNGYFLSAREVGYETMFYLLLLAHEILTQAIFRALGWGGNLPEEKKHTQFYNKSMKPNTFKKAFLIYHFFDSHSNFF